jgi:protein phosphatase
MRLDYAAISDVGRVRKDNQDSGYAGRHLLAVCDGVGGAARGDIASATAIGQLRRLDDEDIEDLLGQVAGALHRAHDRIGDLVDEDPALTGTSTTATVAYFDGTRLGMGHVGDSRAYLLREGELRQLTKDHTFVQTLIDDGQITEEESRVHPHRNLILKAIDGIHDLEPDLFELDTQAGDRLLLCSDGASGVLDSARLTDILRSGNADYAAVELVRASLEAGSTDNVTCLVADVIDDQAEGDTEPMLVGAAAELPKRGGRAMAGMGSLFRGHRSGDTGELEPVPGDIPDDVEFAIAADPIDPEEARYAPREPRRFAWLRRLLVLVFLVGVVWVVAAGAWAWSQKQYYVGEYDGVVTIYRGVNADLPGVELSHPYETSDIALADLSDYDQNQVRDGIGLGDLASARRTVGNLAAERVQQPDDATGDPAGDASSGSARS